MSCYQNSCRFFSSGPTICLQRRCQRRCLNINKVHLPLVTAIYRSYSDYRDNSSTEDRKVRSKKEVNQKRRSHGPPGRVLSFLRIHLGLMCSVSSNDSCVCTCCAHTIIISVLWQPYSLFSGCRQRFLKVILTTINPTKSSEAFLKRPL